MTILVDARFDDYPDIDGSSSGHSGAGCSPIWLIQAPGNGGSDMNGASYPNGAPIDPATGISHVASDVDPLGSGKSVFKMTIDPDQTLLTGGYLRTEFTFPSGNNNDNNAAAATLPNTNSSDYWYWTAFYLPADWNPGAPLVLLQLHDRPDEPYVAGVSAEPGVEPTAILTTCHFSNHYDYTRLQQLQLRMGVSSVDAEVPTLLAHQERRYLYQMSSLPLGRWTEIAIHHHASISDAVGVTEMWVDRYKVFSEHRRNSYSNNYGVGLHIGLYGYWGAANLSRSSIWTKGAAIGDKTYTSFNAFMSALGWPKKTELPGTPSVVCPEGMFN